MAILKDEDILIIKKHATTVNYGKVTLEFRDATLVKVEHQDAELTRAGLIKRGKPAPGGNQ